MSAISCESWDVINRTRLFRDNGIDFRLLPKLTGEDLKTLGVTMVGHRRLLLKAIGVFREPAAHAAPILGTQTSTNAIAEPRPLSVMFCDLSWSYHWPSGCIPRVSNFLFV
jgi:hypothetical protein